MLTGRFTYGLGQVDSTNVFSAFMQTPIAQSPVAQNPPAQWGPTEWGLMLLAGYVAFSVFTQTKRTVGRARGYLSGRRERLAREHESSAEYYRSKRRSR